MRFTELQYKLSIVFGFLLIILTGIVCYRNYILSNNIATYKDSLKELKEKYDRLNNYSLMPYLSNDLRASSKENSILDLEKNRLFKEDTEKEVFDKVLVVRDDINRCDQCLHTIVEALNSHQFDKLKAQTIIFTSEENTRALGVWLRSKSLEIPLYNIRINEQLRSYDIHEKLYLFVLDTKSLNITNLFYPIIQDQTRTDLYLAAVQKKICDFN